MKERFSDNTCSSNEYDNYWAQLIRCHCPDQKNILWTRMPGSQLCRVDDIHLVLCLSVIHFPAVHTDHDCLSTFSCLKHLHQHSGIASDNFTRHTDLHTQMPSQIPFDNCGYQSLTAYSISPGEDSKPEQTQTFTRRYVTEVV